MLVAACTWLFTVRGREKLAHFVPGMGSLIKSEAIAMLPAAGDAARPRGVRQLVKSCSDTIFWADGGGGGSLTGLCWQQFQAVH